MPAIALIATSIPSKTNTLGTEVENLINWFNNLDVQRNYPQLIKKNL